MQQLAGSVRRRYCLENRPNLVHFQPVPCASVQSGPCLATGPADVGVVAAVAAAAGSYCQERCDTAQYASWAAGATMRPSGSWPIP